MKALVLPYSKGGFKLPDFLLYYLCAQVQYAHYWYHSIPYLPHRATEEGDALPIPLNAILPHKRPPLHSNDINTIDTTNAAWQKMTKLAHKIPIYAPAMPLQHHPALSVTQENVGMRLLKQVGIDMLGDLYINGTFIDLNDLAYISTPTILFKFTYYGLQRAIKTFYPTHFREPSQFKTLQSLITEPCNRHLVFRLYTQLQEEIGENNQKALDRWNNILGNPLTKEEWQTVRNAHSKWQSEATALQIPTSNIPHPC